MIGDLRSQILAIQEDASLTDAEKAVRRQALMSGKWQPPPEAAKSPGANHLRRADRLETRTGRARRCIVLERMIRGAPSRPELPRHSPEDVPASAPLPRFGCPCVTGMTWKPRWRRGTHAGEGRGWQEL